MKNKLFQYVLLTAVTVILLGLLFLPFGLLAKADNLGGVSKQGTIIVLASGTTSYATSSNLSGASVVDYGSVQIQATVDVTGSQVFTVTPQFSNDPATCANATNWFTASEYQIFESDAATDTLVTDYEPLSFSITGDGTAAREISAQGRCLRVNVASSSGTFTPTIYVRPLNRQ